MANVCNQTTAESLIIPENAWSLINWLVLSFFIVFPAWKRKRENSSKPKTKPRLCRMERSKSLLLKVQTRLGALNDSMGQSDLATLTTVYRDILTSRLSEGKSLTPGQIAMYRADLQLDSAEFADDFDEQTQI